MADDPAAIAALTLIFTLLTDRTLESEKSKEQVIDMLDRALLALEQRQIFHSSPETVAAARSYIEALLQVLSTIGQQPQGPQGAPRE